MANPVLTPISIWYNLVIGILIVISASVAIKKITYGSRNEFAYTIMCFT